MKPIEVRDNFNFPNIDDLDKVWKGIKFTLVDKEFEFISLLKENLDGDIFFKGFKFKENDTFDWYCSRGRLDEIKFNDYFLLSKSVLSQFDVLVYNSNGTEEVVAAWEIEKKPEFEWVNEFSIDGELASLLYHGGAYGSRFNKPVQEIKRLAQKFCDGLFEEEYRYEFVRCYKSNSAWNSWFIDVIDNTFIIICMKTRTIWILAHTDQN
ncbi:MAG: hypothetical protein V4622_02520 [Bacteroidota bacterium]